MNTTWSWYNDFDAHYCYFGLAANGKELEGWARLDGTWTIALGSRIQVMKNSRWHNVIGGKAEYSGSEASGHVAKLMVAKIAAILMQEIDPHKIAVALTEVDAAGLDIAVGKPFIAEQKLEIEVPIADALKAMGLKFVDMEDGHYDANVSRDHAKDFENAIPEKFEGAADYFPDAVSMAASSAIESGFYSAYNTRILDTMKDCFEAVTNVPCEYIGMNDNGDEVSVSANGGVESCEVDREKDKVKILINNPVHLINTLVAGEGTMGPDLPVDVKVKPEDISSHIHWFRQYFPIFGDSKPSIGDVEPDFNDDFFATELEYRLSEVSLQDCVDALLSADEDADTQVLSEDMEHILEGRIHGPDIMKEFDKQKPVTSTVRSEVIADFGILQVTDPRVKEEMPYKVMRSLSDHDLKLKQLPVQGSEGFLLYSPGEDGIGDLPIATFLPSLGKIKLEKEFEQNLGQIAGNALDRAELLGLVKELAGFFKVKK